MRIISDVHGKLSQYFKIAAESLDGYSLQLGDLGFDYSSLVGNLDAKQHFFFKGNHDNYDENSPYDLHSHVGFRYGELPEDLVGQISLIPQAGTFFCGGGSSIDAGYRALNYLRTEQKTWWYEEELEDWAMQDAIDTYREIEPDIVFSHEFPKSITKEIMGDDTRLLVACGLPEDYASRTSLMLQKMFDWHKPTYWFGGHLHRNFDKKINGCRFVCMRELGFIDI